MVLSVITASGRSEALLEVEVHLQRLRLLRCVPAPSSAGRNHTESIVGGAIGPAGDLLAPRASSQNSGLPFCTDAQVSRCSPARPGTRRLPRSAPDRSTTARRRADRRRHIAARSVMTRSPRYSTTASRRRSAISSRLNPAARSSSSVSVSPSSRTRCAGGLRSAPARTGPTLRKAPLFGCSARRRRHAAPRNCSFATSSGSCSPA